MNWLQKRKLFFREVVSVFDKKEKLYLLLSLSQQVLLSILDLIGVGLIGLLAALAISGVESKRSSGAVARILDVAGIGKSDFRLQIAVIGISATVILLTRTWLSIRLLGRNLRFISLKGASLSKKILENYLYNYGSHANLITEQKFAFACTTGIQSLTIGVVGNGLAVISDLLLLLVLGSALIIINPVTALALTTVFGTIGLFLYKFMGNKARDIGRDKETYGVKSFELINESLRNYRDIYLKGLEGKYSAKFGESRTNLSFALAQENILPNISKYVVETSVVLGSLVMSAIEFSMQDAKTAAANLSIFLAAGSRMAPAVLRIQQSVVQVLANIMPARSALHLIKKFRYLNHEAEFSNQQNVQSQFSPCLEAREISFSYPGTGKKVIKNLSLRISPGEFVGIVGPSGSGKSTLVDCLLGVLPCDTGSVNLSGLPVNLAIKSFPGSVAYVPQTISIVNGTIRQNIAFGLDSELFDDNDFWYALEKAKLETFVKELPGGLSTVLSSDGRNLSGGQIQRIGIARALFLKPKLVVLDEATSALDVETEFEISKFFRDLNQEVTVIAIAHRLSTVKNSSRLVYIDGGKIKGQGSFEELRHLVPNFDRQAGLLGL